MTGKGCLYGCALAMLFVLLSGCGGGSVSGGPPPPPPPPPPPVGTPAWPQWGQNPQHSGSEATVGQSLNTQLADIVYDPFVSQEQAESGGDLVAHYQAPIVAGDDVFMEVETGAYVPCSPPGSGTPPAGQTACGPDAWNLKVWNERRYHWTGGQLMALWTFTSDWKPEPNAGFLGGWEPVFHPALVQATLYVPGAGGTVFKVNATTGAQIKRINPFGSTVDANTFVSGPLTADSQGNLYYNVLKLSDPKIANPWGQSDVLGAWLVKIAADDTTSTVSYATLVPSPPTTCNLSFNSSQLPWPPSPTATPPTGACGSQRPGVNVAPAIAPDGTIYTVSRAHFNDRYSYMVAVNPDLTPKWAASMRGLLSDGCGGLVPIGTSLSPPTPNACRVGQPANGVDPATNEAPAGRVIDDSSSTPTALPDGGVLYGAYTRYNSARGHLFKFGAAGDFQGAYDFGWDTTAAVYPHGGTYSIVVKDNHYFGETGNYCGSPTVCPAQLPDGPYFITQLSAALAPEWQFQSTETQSCHRNPDGSLTCVTDHPNGFEWCINAPAIDSNGVVYVNSEDGHLYALDQGSGIVTVPKQRLFLQLAIGAAYTPLSLGGDGKIYTENDGHLFAVGN